MIKNYLFKMDGIVKMKIKNFKKNNIKVLCCSPEDFNIICTKELLIDIAENYMKNLEKFDKIAVMIDFRGITVSNSYLILKTLPDYAKKLDELSIGRIVASCPIVSSLPVKAIVNAVLKVYPPKIPLKICETPAESLEFISQQLN